MFFNCNEDIGTTVTLFKPYLRQLFFCLQESSIVLLIYLY